MAGIQTNIKTFVLILANLSHNVEPEKQCLLFMANRKITINLKTKFDVHANAFGCYYYLQ